MAGNVWEWCHTPWQENYKDYQSEPENQGKDASRVIRGGSYLSSAYNVRCSARNYYDPNNRDRSVGFRVSLSPFPLISEPSGLCDSE